MSSHPEKPKNPPKPLNPNNHVFHTGDKDAPRKQQLLMQAIELNNRAHQLSAMGKHAEAIPLHQEAVKLKSEYAGPESKEAGVSWQGLAGQYLALGQADEAKESLDMAFKIRVTMMKSGDMDAASTREAYALYWELKGEREKAREMRLRGDDKGQIFCVYGKCTGTTMRRNELKECSACRCAFYCSMECQKKDWKRHKPCCKVMKEKMVEPSA